jgi:DNA modification methylase
MKQLEDYLYYEEENPSLKIYCGDCLEILPLLPKVDLVVTDPPYGIGMDNQKVRTKPNRPNTHGRGGELQYFETEWDREPLRKEYFDIMFCHSKDQIIFGANYYCSYLPNGYGWIYWDKQMGENSFSSGEFAFQSRFVKASCFSHPSMRVKGTREHPTQKPIELLRWCVNFFPLAKDVLDPFLGSGTTLVACKELNRNGIGIEISEKYCAIAKQRLKATTKSLF